MTLRWLLIILFATLVISSCDGDSLFPTIDPPTPALTIDELVVADCYVVRDALEAYAADNGGKYPGYTYPSFTPYLPGHTALANRYTGRSSLPLSIQPQWPGEIGVILFVEEDPSNVDYPFRATGYRVTGRGRYGELVRLENVSGVSQDIVDRYDRTLANVDTVVAAVNSFFEATGQYSSDVNGDTTPAGETLQELLPGGSLLVNPFSVCECEPQDGLALGIAGGIGYLGADGIPGGGVDAFTIEAYGTDLLTIAVRTRQSLEDEMTGTASWYLKSAAEAFAAQNGGEYPRNLDTEETPAGKTLLELTTCAWCENPYTGASPYRDGLATSRGEVGYLPVEENGVVVGYIINALGLFNEEIERFEVLP